jgi:hypothetical protein
LPLRIAAAFLDQAEAIPLRSGIPSFRWVLRRYVGVNDVAHAAEEGAVPTVTSTTTVKPEVG